MGLARVVVLASGKGSNLRALHTYAQAHSDCPFKLAAVISDNKSSGAIAYALEHDLPTALVPFDRKDDRLEWDQRVTHAILRFEPDWVVLAGFMRVLGGHTVNALKGRMVNIHPSLLPSFRGLHAVSQALRAGVRISGCTVHLVDHDVDTGPILGQAAVPVYESDDEQSLQARIQASEHRLFPRVMNKLCGTTLQDETTNTLLVV